MVYSWFFILQRAFCLDLLRKIFLDQCWLTLMQHQPLSENTEKLRSRWFRNAFGPSSIVSSAIHQNRNGTTNIINLYNINIS